MKNDVIQILSLRTLGSILSWCWMTGCGSLGFDDTQMLTLQIQGVHRAPDGADGDSTPRYLSMTFNSLILTDSDGETVDVSPEEPIELSVINRPQIFSETELADYDGKTFNLIEVGFATEGEVGGRYKIRPMEFTTSTFSDATGFEVSTAASFTLNIDVEWLYTPHTDEALADEIFTEPGFVLKLD